MFAIVFLHYHSSIGMSNFPHNPTRRIHPAPHRVQGALNLTWFMGTSTTYEIRHIYEIPRMGNMLALPGACCYVPHFVRGPPAHRLFTIWGLPAGGKNSFYLAHYAFCGIYFNQITVLENFRGNLGADNARFLHFTGNNGCMTGNSTLLRNERNRFLHCRQK